MLDGTKVPPKRYSFCGPGTKLHKRLDENDIPHDWSKPVNQLDQGCYYHDLAYRSRDNAMRHEADKVLRGVAKEVLANPDTDWSQRANARIVNHMMQIKGTLDRFV